MEWIGKELDGYPNKIDVPEYRIARGQSQADVTNGVRYERMVVSPLALPDHLSDRVNKIYMTEGVKQLEALRGMDKLVKPLDVEVVFHFERNLQDESDYWVRNAWTALGPGVVDGILGSIRSRVLQYVFRLRRDYPDFDRDATPINAPPPQQLERLFQVIIMGQGSAATFGSGSAYSQSVGQQIVAGNLNSLKSFLQSQGVEQADLEELDAVMVDVKPTDIDDEQSRIRQWASKVADKASAGGKELVKTAARELILLSVRHYFGNIAGE